MTNSDGDVRSEAEALGWVARNAPFEPDVAVLSGVELGGWFSIAREGSHELMGALRKRIEPARAPPPREANWRSSPYLAAPGHQEDINACMSYATCAMAYARARISGRPVAQLAPRYLHLCSMQLDPEQGVGMEFLTDTLLLMGLPHTFAGADGMKSKAACHLRPQPATNLGVSNVYAITTADEAKHEIALRGPVVAVMEQREAFSKRYGGAIYRATAAPVIGYHAVCLVGYSDIEGCWVGMNSQGTGWGDGGFFRLAYGDSGVLMGELPAFSLDLR